MSIASVMAKLHQPGKRDEPPAHLPVVKEGSVLDYNVQEHQAKRAGRHLDVRIGDKVRGLLSWATKKDLPQPGTAIGIHPQPIHPHSYLGWQGEIPAGYGAGTVKSKQLKKALVTRSSPSELHVTTNGDRLAFLKGPKGWLLAKAKAIQHPTGAAKPKMASISPGAGAALVKGKENYIVQPKVDGSLTYVSLNKGRPEVLSHRTSLRTGNPIVHTERVFGGRPTLNLPKEHRGTSLLAELFGERRGRAIPPQELGGILNANLDESLRRTSQRKIKLKLMPFDVVGSKAPYPERLQKINSILQSLPADKFVAPESATGPAAQRLMQRIKSGRHPLTSEGVIIRPPGGKPIKVKHTKEEDVVVHSTFPGKGKYTGKAGGFYYANEKGERLGKVGTGLSDELRGELDQYTGRIARVKHQGKFRSGKLRAPSLIAIHENRDAQFSSLQRIIRFRERNDDELQPHQERVIRRILRPGQSGLVVAHGLGSGKTRSAIEASKAIGGTPDVVLPAALRENYRKETEKWGGPKANVISQQKLSLHGPAALKSSSLLVIDEGHRARNPKAKLSDAIKASPAKKLILTGTPIYNHPSDIATLVNQAAGRPIVAEGKKFERRYLRPNIIDRVRGRALSHAHELKKKLNQYVDYHAGDPSQLPIISSRIVPVEMTRHQSALYRATTGKIPAGLRIHAKNIERLAPYLTGARQVSNTSHAIDRSSNDQPKLDRVVSDLQQHLRNPKGKALIYSNWLEHGVTPIHEKLQKLGIQHGLFTGEEPMKQRIKTINDYNSGKSRALIVSSSGAEGLDLKGTRLVQVVEPHFNNAKIRQVVGRSARMGSHTHLPASDRRVEVRQYVARPRRRVFGGAKRGVDDILQDVARRKDETNRQITALLSSRSRLIQFAQNHKKLLLAGTPYTEDPSGLSQELLNVVSTPKIPTIPTGRRKKVKKTGEWRQIRKRTVEFEPHPAYMKPGPLGVEGKPIVTQRGVRRDATAADFRDIEGFAGIRAKFRAKVPIDKKKPVRPAGEAFDLARKDVIHHMRVGGNIVHQARARGVSEKDLPGVVREVRKNLELHVGLEQNTHKLRHARLFQDLRAKAVKGIGDANRKQMERKGATLQDLLGPNDIERKASEAMSVLQKPYETGLKKSQDARGIVPKERDYDTIGIALGKTNDEVDTIHRYMHKLRTAASSENTATIRERLSRSSQIFEHPNVKFKPTKISQQIADAMKIDYHVEKFPVFKTAGVAAGVAGAGLLAAKLIGRRKKKASETTEMSATSRVIQFARWDYARKLIKSNPSLFPELAPSPALRRTGKILKGTLARNTALAGRTRGELDPSVVADRIGAFRKISRGKLSNPPEGPGQAAIRHIDDAEAVRRAGVKGGGLIYGGAGPSRDRSIRSTSNPAPWGSLSSDFPSGFPTGQSANPEFRETVQRRIQKVEYGARKEANAKAGRVAAIQIGEARNDAVAAVKHVRRRMTEEREGHSQEAAKLRTRARRRLGIGLGLGVAGGSLAGYRIAKEPPATQFSVGDKLRYGYAAYDNLLWRLSQNAGRLERKLAPVGSVRRDMRHVVKGAIKGVMMPVPGAFESQVVPGAIKTATELSGRIPSVRSRQVDQIMRKVEGKKAIRLQIDNRNVITMGAISLIRKKLAPPSNNPGVSAHDVATGAVEGSLGYVATDKLLQKLAGRDASLPRKFIAGGVVGGIATGLTGYAINKAFQKRKKQPVQTELSSRARILQFALSPIAQRTNRTAVARDRYTKKIHSDDMLRAENFYGKSAVGGGLLGALLKKNLGLTTKSALLIGAGTGLAAQAAVRHGTAQTKDVFGDRSYPAKQVDRIVPTAALLGAGGVAAHKLLGRNSPVTKVAKLLRKNAVALQARARVIRFGVQLPPGYELRKTGPKRERSPLDKWIGSQNAEGVWKPANYKRRAAEAQTYVNRGTGLVKDIHGKLTGQPAVDSRNRPRKREWEKPWVTKAIKGAIWGGSLATVGGIAHAASKGMPGPAADLGAWIKNPQKMRETFRGGYNQLVGRSKIARKIGKPVERAIDRYGTIKSQGRNEAHTVLGWASTKVLNTFKKWAGEAPATAGGPTFSIVTKDLPSETHKKIHKIVDKDLKEKVMTDTERQTAEELERKQKEADRHLRDLGLSAINNRLSRIIHFDEDTVYDDKWEHWVRNRPGIVKRNRRKKTYLETTQGERIKHEAELGATLVGGTLIGVGLPGVLRVLKARSLREAA